MYDIRPILLIQFNYLVTTLGEGGVIIYLRNILITNK